MESSEKTPAPVARTRLDRLFVTWLSHKSTQDYLVRELKRVLAKDDSGVVTSSRQQTSSPSRDDARSTSPSTPPVGLSPRSSRRSRNNSLTAKSTRKLSSAKSKDAKAKVTVSPPPPSLEIPPFYFPFGKPTGENRLGLLKDVHKTFKSFPKGVASLEDFNAVVKVLPVHKEHHCRVCTCPSILCSYAVCVQICCTVLSRMSCIEMGDPRMYVCSSIVQLCSVHDSNIYNIRVLQPII